MKRTQLWIGVLCCGFFLLTTWTVAAQLWPALNRESLAGLQNVTPHFLDLPFSILSILGTVEVTTVLLFVCLFSFSRRWDQVQAVVLFGLLGLIELWGKQFIAQPGPPDETLRYVFRFGMPTGSIETAFSYPSGHALRSAFLTVIVAAWIAKSGASLQTRRVLLVLFLAAEAVMLVSRVTLGEHWLSDIVGGALLGVGFGLFAINGAAKSPAGLDRTRSKADRSGQT